MKNRNILAAALITLTLAACGTAAAAPAATQAPAPAQTAEQTEASAATQAAEQTQAPAEQPKAIRIGYQRNGVWPLIKAKGALEQKFPGTTVTWVVFTSGPPLLEALNAGSIDLGYTGDTPPIFAQAAGTPLVYAGVVSGSGAGSAVLVPENSPIKTLADLKGKKVAFTKASSAHLLTVRALKQGGLSYSDITPVYLQPADARAAFENGSIDAWTIWDPFRQSAISEIHARALVEGDKVAKTNGFIEVHKDFVTKYPDAVRTIVEEAKTWQDWMYKNPDEYSQILAKETGLDVAVVKASLLTEVQAYRWIDDDAIHSQQDVADIFFSLGLIPNKLNIKDDVWIGGKN